MTNEDPLFKFNCFECFVEGTKDMGLEKWTYMRMYTCPICGNKRCPKATHHDNPCTKSNDPNQPGSRYSDDYARDG